MACSLSHDLVFCCLCWSRGFVWARWSLAAMWSLVALVFFAGRMRDGAVPYFSNYPHIGVYNITSSAHGERS